MLKAFNSVIYLLLTFWLLPALAQETKSAPIPVAGGITYQLIGSWDVARLNKILTSDTPAFSGVDVKYTPARNAVKLYRVTYPSVIPEHGNKPTLTSGLLAIPDTTDKSLPMVSYQHGTVYGKHQVPSFPEESPETQLMIAQFAGQGYLLTGADYFGLGISGEPEGYMVKGSHQQATYDMINASRQVLAQMKLADSRLFLAGWSQGGFVTMALLEKLEGIGMKVQGTATASAPLDVFALLNGFLSFPRKFDANWLNSIVILSSFAYENYYGIPGLAHSVLTDEYYDVAKKAYDRQPFNPADIPQDLHKLIRPEYFNAQYFANSAYGRLIASAQAYRWVIASPVHNYYGESDEAITIGVGKMAMTYAQSMGSGNMQVEAISTGKTTHRGTFATAVPLWKIWFDSKR
ncbi:prolyl oligopeptidase family serine peptidase [Rahnella sp. SAP-1]|uniref:Prolyl oligopeptidase family serine peptidase n=1 Tax=Rouxiella aceris TaxID=2703884 RepID=A0A848MQL7_9GAMM|nr:prolyl oligopeptidase family serine peptidase [Rouxiella aceris]NMP28354.1 prolyl oligopeptidase family serine peptidase [Rouxiella aceris]